MKTDRIELCLAQYKSWSEKLGISSTTDVNRIINGGGSDWLINISEIWHEQNISDISQEIKESAMRKKIILISGPSSSGKTSFAHRLQLHLKVLGINAIALSLDNYYKDESEMPENSDGSRDYEALEAIDYCRFNSNVSQLLRGEEVFVPVYNFENRESTRKPLKLHKDDIIIAEGIHGLNEKLSSNIPADKKYKIYCSALTALSNDDGTRIKSRTNRLIRRLIRDYYFRASSYEFTFELWPKVEEGAQKNIFPFTNSADVIFNSSLLYELAVYKKHLNQIFKAAPKKNEMISQLLNLVNGFNDIPDDEIPRTSIVREFVGGSTLF